MLLTENLSATCSTQQYQVRAHPRRGYVRFDGKKVSSSYVKAYCKSLSQGSEYAMPLFKSEKPKDWPNSKEQIVLWTENDKRKGDRSI